MIVELKILLVAMSPVLELRGAIPLALKSYNLPLWSGIFFSLLGNLIPVLFLLLFLEPVSRFLRERFVFFERFFGWLFAKTERSHRKKFKKLDKFALILLVAVPLPLTGGWTASICAFLFGIKFRQSFPLILSGLLIATLIVTFLTLTI